MTARRLEGGFDLRCAPDSRGQSVLRRQWFRAPVHVSKPHHDAGALVVNVVNPTAGLLEGDRVHLRAEVERDARLVLATPSATRLHGTRGDGWAEARQEFRVRAGGSLEVWGEPLIPQRGARYHQHTTLALEPDAELIFLETVAAGRIASGEAFAFEELRWSTDLRVGERWLVRERYRLTPGHPSLGALRGRFPRGYWGGGFLVSPGLAAAPPTWERLLALDVTDQWVGVTSLGAPGAFACRLAAGDSLAFRRVCQAWREDVYAALHRAAPDVRRGF